VSVSKASKADVAEISRRTTVPTIERIEDFNEAINILCHGDTGAGKNRLWGHLPNLVILAIEEGSISIKKAGIKGAKVLRCHSWADIVGSYEDLRDNPDKYWDDDVPLNERWVMIDSVTKAQSMCIRHIMKMVILANPARDEHVPAQGDHFKWQLSIKQFVEDFNELPINTVWLARSMVRENPDGMDIIVPSIEGKDYGISAWVCGEMSLLCYLKKERVGKGDSAKIVRKLYTNEHDVYWCKDWYDVLPHVVQFESEAGVAQKLVAMIQGTQSAPKKIKVTAPKKTTTKRKA
jgi:hypothetical protein